MHSDLYSFFFFFNDTATTEIYTLSLHDALPISFGQHGGSGPGVSGVVRIEDALPMIEQNRAKTTGTVPSGVLPPAEPLKPFPLECLKAALLPDKYDWRPYSMNVGDFYIELSTPPIEDRSQE